MCLIAKSQFSINNVCYTRATIAKKDIVCYKILNYNLSSFHMFFPYSLGKQEIDDNFPNLIWSDLSVDKYAFHSYKSLDILKEYLEMNNKHDISGFIVECIIPKGSRYYKGIHNHPLIRGYASNQIIPKKIIGVTDDKINSFYVRNPDMPIFSILPSIDCLTNYEHGLINTGEIISMPNYINYLNNKQENSSCA